MLLLMKGLADVVAMKLSVEKTGFIIREEVITAIVVRASSDAAEALEGGAEMRRLVDVVNCWCLRDQGRKLWHR